MVFSFLEKINLEEKFSLINELKNIDEIYSSDPARAIATVKCIAEKNLKIKLDKKIDEREFRIEKLSDLTSNSCPHGIFRANKIIVSNIIPMTDEIAMDFYRKADFVSDVRKCLEDIRNRKKASCIV